MRRILHLFAICTLALSSVSCRAIQVQRQESVENINHPQVLYWFWTPEIVEQDGYLTDLEFIAENTPFDLIFITAREKLDFYDYDRMKPIFAKCVAKAHELGLKMGLQLWDNYNDMPQEAMASTIVEGRLTLDKYGRASYIGAEKNIRYNNIPRATDVKPIDSELLRAYCFEGDGEDYYVASSLEEITSKCRSQKRDAGRVKVDIDMGREYSGRTVYIMTQHTYDWNDIYGGYAAAEFTRALDEYSDIPFDGVGLDEYKHLQMHHASNIVKMTGSGWNERLYSEAMGELYKSQYDRDIIEDMFAMRYVAKGEDSLRFRAINSYMDIMRSGPLMVEKQVYSDAKRLFGEECFIGLHNTYHTLSTDEIWQTGANWWTLPREYGHSDERCALPTQMGIAACAPQDVLYNMYYDRDASVIYQKVAMTLPFGIRTHYHAMNDNHGWGVKLESPEFLQGITPIENAARLLNHFNPSAPKLNTLIVFGMEAKQSDYPDKESSNVLHLNGAINPEQIAVDLWEMGYRNAIVSSDVVEEGLIEVEKNGALSINGNRFEQLIYLYPNHAKPSVIELLSQVANRGAKPIIVGELLTNFAGESLSYEDTPLCEQAIFVDGDSAEDIASHLKQEVSLPDYASINRDGSYVEVLPQELIDQMDVEFNIHLPRGDYSGVCQGMIALQASRRVEKIAAKGLTELRCGDKVILQLDSPADILYNRAERKLVVYGDDITIIENNL